MGFYLNKSYFSIKILDFKMKYFNFFAIIWYILNVDLSYSAITIIRGKTTRPSTTNGSTGFPYYNQLRSEKYLQRCGTKYPSHPWPVGEGMKCNCLQLEGLCKKIYAPVCSTPGEMFVNFCYFCSHVGRKGRLGGLTYASEAKRRNHFFLGFYCPKH